MSRTINNLHSKLGVTFTGVVEILVSTITSLSVCALAGFKITMIPWFVLNIQLSPLLVNTILGSFFPSLSHSLGLRICLPWYVSPVSVPRSAQRACRSMPYIPLLSPSLLRSVLQKA